MSQKNLETTGFSIRAEIEKIRSLPKEKRWEYVGMYYKLPLLLLAASLVVFWMLASFAVSAVRGTFFPKEPISIAVAVPDFTNCDGWMAECENAIGYDEKKENLQVLVCAPYTPERDDFVISSTLWFTAGQPDVFLVDQASYDYLLPLDVLTAISDWPEPLRDLATERQVDAFGLDISDTTFVRQHCPGQTVYLCMTSVGQGTTRAVDIVQYLLSESAS